MASRDGEVKRVLQGKGKAVQFLFSALSNEGYTIVPRSVSIGAGAQEELGHKHFTP